MSSTTTPSAFQSLLARLRGAGASSPRPAAPSSGRRWLRVLGYLFFFLFAFVLFTYLTFPYDRVRDYVVHRIEQALPGSEVEIVGLEPAWLTGIEARGVRIRLPPEASEPAPAGATEPARRPVRPSITLPYLYARVSILSYLLGTTELVFEVETDGGGTIDGTLSDTGTESHLTAHLDAVDLRRMTILRQALPVALGGEVSGDIDLHISDDEAATDGTIQLRIAEATLGDEQFQVPMPIPGLAALQLTRIELGEVALDINVEDGIGRVTRFSGDGTDLLVRGTGTVRVHRSLRTTTLDLLLRAAIQPAYLTRNPAVQGALDLAGTSPFVAPYRAADGAFQVRLQGSAAGHMTALAAGSQTIPD